MSPRGSNFVVLWAASEHYARPQFVVAYSEGLEDAMPEAFDEQIAKAKSWFADFGDESDGPWTFWTTHEAISLPERPTAEVE